MLEVREINVHWISLYDSVIDKEVPQVDMSHRICGKSRERVISGGGSAGAGCSRQPAEGGRRIQVGHKKCNQPVPTTGSGFKPRCSGHSVVNIRLIIILELNCRSTMIHSFFNSYNKNSGGQLACPANTSISCILYGSCLYWHFTSDSL